MTEIRELRALRKLARDIKTRKAAANASNSSTRFASLPLVDLIPALSPKIRGNQTVAPLHLQPLLDELETAIQARETGQRFFWCSVPPRHWKAVENSTPMLTRRGWTTAGDVRVGDELVGSNGKFTRVSGRTEWKNVALYRVEFSDGASLVTCGAHRWSVRQRYGGPWRVINTAELSADLFESDGRHKWRIPVVAPVAGKLSRLAKPTARNRPRRFVSGIFPVEKGDATCFEVEASDHLFCAGSDLVVTHNSETCKHALVKHLLRWPEEMVAYCTHTGSFAAKQNRDIRRIAARAGLKFAQDSNRQDEWELTTGGGCTARGVGGELTGRGFRLIVVDDPLKGREEAESAIERQKVWDWLEDDVITRLSPDGALFMPHTRWHPDDPIGRAIKEGKWRGINLRALSGPNDDEPLLPSVWSFEHLDAIRQSNPYKYASLYDGSPRPRGGRLFGEPSWYSQSELPTHSFHCCHGVDLAYSKKSYADRSIIVTGIKQRGDDRIFVVNARVERVQATDFVAVGKTELRKRPGSVRWYFAGPEKGVADLMSKAGFHMQAMPATADKYSRAQTAAALWNTGKILLPSGDEDEPAPDWVNELIEEVSQFTGVNDANDDIVDALVAMADQFGVQTPSEPDAPKPVIANEGRWQDFEASMGF